MIHSRQFCYVRRGKEMLKRKSLNVLLVLVISIYTFSPVSAANIKTGVSCTKMNLKAKVGSKNYRCANNPYLKPESLTWTLRECLRAQTLLNSSKKQYEDWKGIAASAGPDGEKLMKDLLASIAGLEDTMKNELCKKGA